jgi:ADP-ribose pyrophosphatase YjhB (NUDIX family)
MKSYHPRPDDHGRPVVVVVPSRSTDTKSWADPEQIATTTPGAPVSEALNGIVFTEWINAPTTAAGWEDHVTISTRPFSEPPIVSAPDKSAASGVVVVEADSRVWVASPTNAFGGYVNTFPKGKLEQGLSMRGNALKEGFEESGLQVLLTAFLCDSHRSTSVTRYYLARRVGGHPASMGWETQAVSLVPRARLAEFVTHANDQVILQALLALG